MVNRCVYQITNGIVLCKNKLIFFYKYLPVNERISHFLMEISTHLDDDRRGERLRQGVQVAIMGAPNVGKSSLLNVLCELFVF